MAERYSLHQAIESERAASEYERCQGRLGYEPLDPLEKEKVRSAREALIARFGKSFGGHYGWAAEHLKISQPTFVEIERAVEIDHFRAFYRMASHAVHANPKGVYFKLGLLDESHLLIAGATNAGLADPGQNTALSLSQITSSLGGIRKDVDSVVVLKLMLRLCEEINEGFIDAHEQLRVDSFRPNA